MDNKKTGVEFIAEERQRQIEVEKWTLQHDQDMHYEGELAKAAACYANPIFNEQKAVVGGLLGEHIAPEFWPWEARWYKPSPDNRIKELTKAGALIAAEIDRLQNLNENANQ